MLKKIIKLRILFLVAPYLTPTAVWAVEPGANDAEGRVLEEVVVTATKRAKSEREIPASIDAFLGDELEEQGIFSLEDIVRRAPGVSLSKNLGGDNARITVRGIETQLATLGGSQTFGIFFDTLSIVNPTVAGSQPDIDAFDMQSVEVLKGPQGTLFGGAALGGAVRYVPMPATADTQAIRLFYSVTKPDMSESDGESFGMSINQPIGEHFAIRLSGTERKYPGVYDNLTPGHEKVDVDKSENSHARGMVHWAPIDQMVLSYVYQTIDILEEDQGLADNPDTYSRRNTPTPTPTDSQVIIKGGKIELDVSEWLTTAPFSVVVESYRILKDREQVLAIERALGTEDLDGSATSQFNTRSKSEATELRLVSTSPTTIGFGWGILNNWDWILGYVEQETDQYLLVTVDSDPLQGVSGALEQLLGSSVPLGTPVDSNLSALAVTQTALTLEKAFYFDFTRTFFGQFEFSYGGRFFEIGSDELVVNDSFGAETESDSTAPVEEGFTPKLALTWFINDDFSVYASAAKGFRFGGTNFYVVPVEDQTAPDHYESDSLWNYEIGFRSEWFEKRLIADVTGFRIDWEDIQIIQSSDNGVDNFVNNIGSAQVDGVEFSFQYLAPFNLTLTGNAALVDARTADEFESVDGAVPIGTRLPASSTKSGSVRLMHEVQFGAVSIMSSITQTYKGSSQTKLIAGDQLGSLSTTDVAFNFSFESWPMRPTVRVIASNINNKRAASNIESYEASETPNNELNTDYFFNRPRTYTITLDLSF